ncbi:response regulator transcription factor [Paraburkholderia sp. J67]|uniref:response regulator transcription factor n=1 Tax=Paraburkholderia sp. J67 TaxID=2805435 RepID=UPI002ABE1BDC|nr:response regulator transcription factor [Paraburkholderia sp. J67]
MSTSVVIAESQTVTRQAVRLLVERAGYRVLAEAADGLSAVQRVLQQRPDIVILGLRMRRLSGLEAIGRIRRELPATRFVVLSALDSAHWTGLAAQAGATAFVSKQGELSELTAALDAVRRGRSWFPVTDDGIAPAHNTAASEAAQLDALSARERLVLSYLVKGERLRHIAAELALSESTVSTYKRRLLQKLNATSVVELAEIVRRSEADTPRTSHTFAPARDNPAIDREKGLARFVFDALPFHVSVRDCEGRVVLLNRYSQEALGDRAQWLVGTDFIEHARLLGASLDQARELQRTFADAVRHGTAYRREIMLDGANGVVAALHWGAPLRDGGTIEAMLCGSLNVTDQEQAFVALRDKLASAELSARQKDGLLHHFVQTLAPEVERLGALIARQHETARTSAAASEAGAAVESLRATLNRLAMLVRVQDDTSAGRLERSVPADLVRAAIDEARARHAQAQIDLDIATPRSAARPALMDRQAFDDLLGLLIEAALGGASRTRLVTIALSTSARTRGLLDLQLVFDAVPPGAKPRPRTRERNGWLMPACRKIAEKMGASLDSIEDGPRSRIVLKGQFQRSQDEPG